MAHFLRDERITDLSITEDNLVQLSTTFEDRAQMMNATLGDDKSSDKEAFVTYVIRFDSKGYRVFSIHDLLKYFRLARSVERIIITLETVESVRTNRQFGTVMELRLDEADLTACFLSVTSDDKDWVDASFSAVQDTLSKSKTRNGWVRTAWTMFGVQLVGVTLGFILSLWAAAKISPRLTIESAFILSFLFALLIFSNTWTFLSQQIIRIMNMAFPNIKFIRRDKERLHWLLQAVVGGAVGAAVLFVLGQAAAFLLEILKTIVTPNA